MARRRNDAEVTQQGRRPTVYTCANCDDGWIPEVYETITWKIDGRRITRQVPYQWLMPENSEAQDRWVSYHGAVRRCPCVKSELVKELPEAVPMPAKIANARIGEIAKRMPDPEFW